MIPTHPTPQLAHSLLNPYSPRVTRLPLPPTFASANLSSVHSRHRRLGNPPQSPQRDFFFQLLHLKTAIDSQLCRLGNPKAIGYNCSSAIQSQHRRLLNNL